MFNFNDGIKMYIQNIINISFNILHGMDINLDTIASMERQLLNTCFLIVLAFVMTFWRLAKGDDTY